MASALLMGIPLLVGSVKGGIDNNKSNQGLRASICSLNKSIKTTTDTYKQLLTADDTEKEQLQSEFQQNMQTIATNHVWPSAQHLRDGDSWLRRDC